MSLRALALVPLAAALLATGCGGATPSTPHDGRPPAPARSTPAQSSNGLLVGATDLRLGDASVGSRRTGVRELPVPQRRIDPDRLRRHAANRQGIGAGASCPDQDLLPDGTNTAAVIASTLCLLNGERADAGLPPLTQDDRLAAAALEHSQDMVANHYFDHVALDGRDVVDRIRASGYLPDDQPWTIGENLAWGTGTLATPWSIVLAWMNSQGHRENILRSAFKQIGFGVVPGNPHTTDGIGATYTTTFGSLSAAGPSSTRSGSPAPAAAAPAKPAARKSAVTPTHTSSARRRARAARRHERRLHAKATRAARAARA
ncbi:MAG: hypothetical protein QOE86_4580 [Solirubrobacteraceae bacterium]|nr:hypothetical protein [Solirubrobacteraceae bacterium]